VKRRHSVFFAVFTGLCVVLLLVYLFGYVQNSYGSRHMNEQAWKNYVEFDVSMKVNQFPHVLKKEFVPPVFEALKKIYEKNSFKNVSSRSECVIPKIFHYIWLGIKLPDKYRPFLQSWLDKHPDWIFIFWVDNPENYDLGTLVNGANFARVKEVICDQKSKGGRFVIDVKNLSFSNRVFFDGTRNYGERSDILKWEVVYRFGGVYIDIDCECFKPLDPLHHMYDFYTGVQPLDTNLMQLGAALYGSIPGHPILKHCVEKIAHDRKYQQIVVKTGPIHFTKAFLAVADKHGYIDVALPASYFYPCDYEQAGHPETEWKRPESFATHHWAGSWLKKEGWDRSV